ncbi:hypothetical protein [Bacillus sp. Marseille-P3661]|uniref:hypothetical protein n=1 Tax=Bacillus sp. Marseille-P3661 TaxID=1936234 RepID=UPI000C833EEE|nr:hypothetical protein [Bacillus sp. Marseille-P3661]
MTEIFYEDKLVAAVLFTLALCVSQLAVFVIKKYRGNKIEGLHILYHETLAYTDNKRSKRITYFVIVPIMIYVIYDLLARFLGNTHILYNLFVYIVSGGFGLLVALTVASLLAAFLLYKNGHTLLKYQANMYLTLLVIGFIFGGLYYLTVEAFYRNSFVIILLISMINLSITRKIKRKLVSERVI